MEPEFWHGKWRDDDIGFHEGAPNRLLTAHADALPAPEAGQVFVPLCGKTRDIGWLLSRGWTVSGAELSETAVAALFDDLGLAPEIANLGALKRYRANGLEVFVGNIFQVTADQLGPVGAVYDRAALVALPADMRQHYAAHLAAITGRAPQLLITFEYDQSEMNGPPFSVGEPQVRQCYEEAYHLTRRAQTDVPGGLRGRIPAQESVWLLTPRQGS